MKYNLTKQPDKLQVNNFGPINSADVEFGDLTVLVGPQATGKSIFLQLLKLIIDLPHVKYEFRRAGVDWEAQMPKFLDVYFGEGMHSLWNSSTKINFKGVFNLQQAIASGQARQGESMFFIPAQRVAAGFRLLRFRRTICCSRIQRTIKGVDWGLWHIGHFIPCASKAQR
jgi:hypothetical protein